MLSRIADTDHNGRYFFERRVTEHGNLVLRFIRSLVKDDIRNSVADTFVAGSFGFVPRYFGTREDLQREVEHVLFRPYFFAVEDIVVVIHARFGQMKWDLVFVVVVAQVRTEADETAQVAVFEFGIDGYLLGVDEHLQVLVLAHVVTRILVHRSGVTRTKVCHAENHRLLVLRNQLCLSRIGLTAHAGRQHIVDR